MFHFSARERWCCSKYKLHALPIVGLCFNGHCYKTGSSSYTFWITTSLTQLAVDSRYFYDYVRWRQMGLSPDSVVHILGIYSNKYWTIVHTKAFWDKVSEKVVKHYEVWNNQIVILELNSRYGSSVVIFRTAWNVATYKMAAYNIWLNLLQDILLQEQARPLY